MARFLIEEEGRPTRAFRLVTDAIIVGRIDTADLVLPDPDVSRKHALVERADGRWLLSDNGSANGTVVNGVTVEQHALADGDVLVLGKFTLTFRNEDEGELPDYAEADEADAARTNLGGAPPPPDPVPTMLAPSLEDATGAVHPIGSALSFGSDFPASGILPFVSPGSVVAQDGGASARRGSFLVPMYVNGKSVVNVRLKDGDELRVGGSRFVYRGP